MLVFVVSEGKERFSGIRIMEEIIVYFGLWLYYISLK